MEIAEFAGNFEPAGTDFIIISAKEFIQKLKGEFKLICLRATLPELD
jgi:hypothetical protein